MSEIISLRKRLKSIKSIEQSTKALQIITSAKIKTFQNLFKSFAEYKLELEEIYALVNQSKGILKISNPNQDQPGTSPEKIAVIIVVTSNRGFCGSFNQNVIFSTNQLIAQLKAEGKTVKLYLIGKKAVAYYKPEHFNILGIDIKLADKPEPKDTLRLVAHFIAENQKGKIAEVYLSYNEYKSIVVQTPTSLKLLPFDLALAKTTAHPNPELDIIFEPSPPEIAAASFLHYLSIFFLSKIMGSIVGEMGARLIITKNAVDNSRDLIGQLTLKINKARQAGITTELSELQSNFEILKT